MRRLIMIPIVFGLIIATPGTLFEWFQGEPSHLLLRHAIEGWLVGGGVGGILVLIHLLLVKRITGKLSASACDVFQERAIVLQAPYDLAFDLSKESLDELRWHTIKTENRATGEIKAQTPFSTTTWGEHISFKIKRVTEQLTQVEVSSKPIWRIMIIDFCNNLRNVEEISKYLSKHGSGSKSFDYTTVPHRS